MRRALIYIHSMISSTARLLFGLWWFGSYMPLVPLMPRPNGGQRDLGIEMDEPGFKKGPWTPEEDNILKDYVNRHGQGNWNIVQKETGLLRCGKSCRLRWANHLRPDLKKGALTKEEESKIFQLHHKYGNKWARMASELPGRTDNEIKNFWNTRAKKDARNKLSPPSPSPSPAKLFSQVQPIYSHGQIRSPIPNEFLDPPYPYHHQATARSCQLSASEGIYMDGRTMIRTRLGLVLPAGSGSKHGLIYEGCPPPVKKSRPTPPQWGPILPDSGNYISTSATAPKSGLPSFQFQHYHPNPQFSIPSNYAPYPSSPAVPLHPFFTGDQGNGSGAPHLVYGNHRKTQNHVDSLNNLLISHQMIPVHRSEASIQKVSDKQVPDDAVQVDQWFADPTFSSDG